MKNKHCWSGLCQQLLAVHFLYCMNATKGMHTKEGGFCTSSLITRPTQSTVVAVKQDFWMSTLVPINHDERLANVCVLKEQFTEDAYWMHAVLFERRRDREGERAIQQEKEEETEERESQGQTEGEVISRRRAVSQKNRAEEKAREEEMTRGMWGEGPVGKARGTETVLLRQLSQQQEALPWRAACTAHMQRHNTHTHTQEWKEYLYLRVTRADAHVWL